MSKLHGGRHKKPFENDKMKKVIATAATAAAVQMMQLVTRAVVVPKKLKSDMLIAL